MMSQRASRSRLALVAVAVPALAGGCAGTPATAPPTATATAAAPPSVAATPRPTADLPALTDIVDAGAVAFVIGPAPDFIVLSDGFAFVSAAGGGTGHVAKIDATGKIVADYDVPGGSCAALAVGFGAVWSATCPGPGLARIDVDTGTITPIQTGPGTDSEMNIAAGEDAVWVTGSGSPRVLIKVDPATNEVVERWTLPGLPNGAQAAFGAVWVADPSLNVVLRIDPLDGHVVATIPVGVRPQFFTTGAGAVWTMNQVDGTVSRIDPATNSVTATIAVAEGIFGGDIAVGGGFVWLRGSDSLLWKIDPATNAVVAFYGPASGSGSVAADDDAVWVTAHDTQTIWRLPLE